MYKSIAVVRGKILKSSKEQNILNDLMGVPISEKLLNSKAIQLELLTLQASTCSIDVYHNVAVNPVQGDLYITEHSVSFYSPLADGTTKVSTVILQDNCR